jgi:membrane-associated protease RseP (regulator of RpoE activity)
MEQLGERLEEKWERIDNRRDRDDDDDQDVEKKDGGDFPFLGVNIEMISKEKAQKLGIDNPYGAYVTNIFKNTGAEKAGIQPFDFIYGVDEYRTGDEQGLIDILGKFHPGDEVSVHFYRKGKKMSLNVKLGAKPDKMIEEKINHCDRPFLGIINDFPEEREQGVKVNVVKKSTAESSGLQNGDIITAMNGNRIIDWMDVTIAIDNMRKGESIAVEYLRGGSKSKASGVIKTVGETKECDRNAIVKDLNNKMPEIKLNLPPGRESKPGTAPRPSLGDVTVRMENISSQDADNMRSRYGIDMAGDNSLSINNLSLSPNPNQGLFSLSFSLPGSGQTSIRLFNSTGRQIYDYDLGNFTGQFSDDVDISQNGTGNYYLEIRQASRAMTRKIILAKN